MAEQKEEAGVQKVKWTRKGTPKAKWGCLTCKIRHIKCDEQKPACIRCTSTGRSCDFLKPSIERNRPTKLAPKQPRNLRRLNLLLPKDAEAESTTSSSPSPGPHDVALVPRPSSLPSSLWMDPDEVTYFDYFRSVSVHDLSGYFEDSLWNTVLLQAAYSEPSLKQAAVAVGAWHRCQSEKQPNRKSVEKYSVLKYLEAVKTLNERLDESPGSAELAILASFLFMALETFQGGDRAALTHFEGAFAILRSLQQQEPPQKLVYCAPTADSSLHDTKSPSPRDRCGIVANSETYSILSTRLSGPKNLPSNLKDLEASFTRLDIQASTFAKPYKPKSHAPPSLPKHFASLSEARAALDAIIASMHYLLGFGIDLQTNSFENLASISHPIPTSHIQGLFTVWTSLFTTFLAEQPTFLPTEPIAVLKIQLLSAQVYLQNYLAPNQVAYDSFQTSFSEVIELAEAVVSPPILPSRSRTRFSFDIGIIQPLYFVALKCRDGLLRRRAKRVLESAGREGVWDGKAMAAVAGWAIEREEEGGQVVERGIVSEEMRLHDLALVFNRAEKRVKIVGMRRSREIDMEWEYVNGEVKW